MLSFVNATTRDSNFTRRNSTISDEENVATAWIISSMSLLGIVGNSYCLLFIKNHMSHLRPSTTSLFLNLTITTFIFSAFALPVQAYSLFAGSSSTFAQGHHMAFCRFNGFLFLLLGFVCAYCHAGISLERLFITILSDRFPVLGTRKATCLLIISTWACPVCILVWPLFGIGGRYSFNRQVDRCLLKNYPDSIYTELYKVLYSIVPLLIITVSYSLVIRAVHLSAAKVQQRRNRRVGFSTIELQDVPNRTELKPVTSTHSAKPSSRRMSTLSPKEAKATKVALISCLAFAVCFMPIALVGMIPRYISSAARVFSSYFFMFGCVVNPLIYTLLSARKLPFRTFRRCTTKNRNAILPDPSPRNKT